MGKTPTPRRILAAFLFTLYLSTPYLNILPVPTFTASPSAPSQSTGSTSSSASATVQSTQSGSIIVNGSFSNALLDPIRPRLYLVNASGNSITVLNTTANTVIANVFVGSAPSGMDVSVDDASLYVALSGSSSLATVDLASLRLTNTIHLPASPSRVAAGRLGRAYVTTGGLVFIADTNASRIIGNFTSEDSGEIAVISQDRKTLYLGAAGISPATISKYSVSTDNPSLISTVPFDSIGSNLEDFTVSPDGSRLYIASGAPYYCQVVNTTDWTSVGRLITGAYPASVGLALGGRLAAVSHWPYPSEVTVFDTTTFLPTRNFTALEPNGAPFLVRASEDGSRLYVLDSPDWGGSKGRLEVFNTQATTTTTSSTTTAATTTTSTTTTQTLTTKTVSIVTTATTSVTSTLTTVSTLTSTVTTASTLTSTILSTTTSTVTAAAPQFSAGDMLIGGVAVLALVVALAGIRVRTRNHHSRQD